MRVAGLFAIVGFLLLVVQLVFGGVLNEATHDSQPLTTVPLGAGSVCLWVAFWRSLATGSAAAVLAALFGLGSFLLIGYAILAIYPAFVSAPVYVAASAALLVLAITLGIVASTNKRATSHGATLRE